MSRPLQSQGGDTMQSSYDICRFKYDLHAQGAATYSSTTRGKYSDTTQFGMSTMELMRRSAQTLHNM